MNAEMTPLEELFNLKLSLGHAMQQSLGGDSDLVAVLRHLSNKKAIECFDSCQPAASPMHLYQGDWINTVNMNGASPNGLSSNIQSQLLPDLTSLEVFQHLEVLRQQQARQLQETQQQLQFLQQQQQLQALQQQQRQLQALQQQHGQLQNSLAQHVTLPLSEDYLSPPNTNNSFPDPESVQDVELFGFKSSDLPHHQAMIQPDARGFNMVGRLSPLSGNLLGQVNNASQYMPRFAPQRSLSATALLTSPSSKVVSPPVSRVLLPPSEEAAATAPSRAKPHRDGSFRRPSKAQRNAPRKSVSHLVPQAPSWANASWNPMTSVVNGGGGAYTGTGVFLPHFDEDATKPSQA